MDAVNTLDRAADITRSDDGVVGSIDASVEEIQQDLDYGGCQTGLHSSSGQIPISLMLSTSHSELPWIYVDGPKILRN